MLELKNIVKSYHTAGFTQVALDDVSVTLRDNEFVAVLGPSGSGKTTLLNIVGGLDHYESGDLIIDGISTRKYRDRDWDTYRNNRIGFVFQSYNLIPHQSVLANVELALTLSGVGKTERRQRARAALETVGLGEHLHKRPNQLSGGQMQRVAIARALINDPEILLADEPTGALDSKTSVQIMALLQEIAADRLVVMVTHNPDLADRYANRTINLSDGKIVADSRPVSESELAEPEARPSRRARMSFFTAVALSFSNLMTKKGRTLMMAFAGSIGIIGIAGILSLANGVNNYIKTVEEETLSIYPLSISSTGMDMTSLLVGSTAAGEEEDEEAENAGEGDDGISNWALNQEEVDEGVLDEAPIIANMLDNVRNNDLVSLKAYLDSPESGIQEYVNTIQYSYNVTPQIYLPQTDPEVHQVHPNRSFTALGMGSEMTGSSLLSSFQSVDMFDELLADWQVYGEQYQVLAGEWPDEPNEILLVTNYGHRLSDVLLYSMGLRDYHELNSMVESFINEEDITTPTDRLSFSYAELLAVEFKLVYNSDYYLHDDNYDVWVSHADDVEYLKQLVAGAQTLRICGIAAPNEPSDTITLTPGLYYTSALVDEVIEHSRSSEVTQYQLANPQLNIFTGSTFVEEAERSPMDDFDMGSMFSIDEEAVTSAFSMDDSALKSMDFSSILDPEAVMKQMPAMDMGSAMSGVEPPAGIDQTIAKVMQNAMASTMEPLISAYFAWYAEVSAQDPVAYPPTEMAAHFQEFMGSAQAQGIIGAAMGGIAQDPAMLEYQGQMQTYQESMQTALTAYIQGYMQQMLTLMSQQIATNMEAAMADLTANMSSAMRIDQEAFANAFQFNLSVEELTALMAGMMSSETSSLDNNLRNLGYADFAKPSSIDIYPIDFDGKQRVLDILDGYNERMEAAGEPDKAITYTDIVGALMSSVTEIIDMISMVLVAFVAISLVVSSIMIGVITYISVLERKKEIGILRSIGASKGDIANVFNAETLIVGFVAGCLGILITLLLSIPVNIIVDSIYNIQNIALMPPLPAVILIAVSCFLTFLSGLIPSQAASRKDPVEALRSE